MMGMTSQTGTSHSSLATTPPSTVQPMRQSSVAPPPTHRVKSQTSHQLSVSAAAAPAAPAKTRPQSGNLLQSPESGYGGRQHGARQLSVKDNTAPGLPHQQSSVRESQSPQGTTSTQQSPQQQSQQQQQHLLKPTMSKQVTSARSAIMLFSHVLMAGMYEISAAAYGCLENSVDRTKGTSSAGVQPC